MKINSSTTILPITAVKVMLYGFPGVWKTTFAMTASRPLLRDWDNGIKRVNAKYRTSFTDPLLKWEDGLDIGSAEELTDIDTLIDDTAGKAVDAYAEFLKRSPKNKRADGNLTIQAYGSLASGYRSYYNSLLATGKDLVFVCHHKEEKGKGEGDYFYRPDITGQSMSMLVREMDLVGFVFIKDQRRCVTFNSTEEYLAKNSAGLPPFLFLDEWSLDQIIQLYREHVNADNQEYANYIAQMSVINTMLSTATNAEHINEVVKHCVEIGKLNNWVWTAKEEAKHALLTRKNELALLPDKANPGFYVDNVAVEPAGEIATAPVDEALPPDDENKHLAVEPVGGTPSADVKAVQSDSLGMTEEAAVVVTTALQALSAIEEKKAPEEANQEAVNEVDEFLKSKGQPAAKSKLKATPQL